MVNRVWHLLREPGPDTNYPAPQIGDFAYPVVVRDLNIALGQFVSEAGLPMALSERYATLPVYILPNGDYPLPADLASLLRVEYTPYGQQTRVLSGLSPVEWDSMTGGIQPLASGQPYYYRRPFAGYIRLSPTPGPGNASGYPAGDFVIGGLPVAGQTITASFVYNGVTTTTEPYTVLTGGTLAKVALNLSQKINASTAVTGAGAFLSPSAVGTSGADVVITANANTPAALAIQYFATVTGAGMTATPGAKTTVQPTGDTITFYYTSLGTVLVLGGDTPGIAPQFHMAPVYRVLMDYWPVKGDLAMARDYERKYEVMVKRAKMLVYDSDQSTAFTMAGEDDSSGFPMSW
jgi:hypothetical protein